MGSRNDLYEPVPWEVAIEWTGIIGSPFCNLPTGTKWVLTVLSKYGDKDGQNIFPSQRELTYRTVLSLKTVNHALQLAEIEGWIIRTLKDRPNGRGYKSHSYTLTVPGFVADYAIGKHRFWEPKYTEKLVIEDDRVRIVRRGP